MRLRPLPEWSYGWRFHGIGGRYGYFPKVTLLANQIFTAFPEEVSALKFYLLDCGCIYYQRVFPDGTPDTKTGIYRDAEQGPCEVCLLQDATWEEGSLDEVTVYNSKFEVAEN